MIVKPSSPRQKPAVKALLLSLLMLPVALAAQDFDALVAEGKPQLSGVKSEPSLGETHVPEGTPVAQDQDFPLSGPHWPTATASGFYSAPQAKGGLIHALEHGQVVVYYDKPGFKAVSRLKKWSQDRASFWSGLVAVPHEGLGAGLVLTAWQHRLDVPAFDEATLAAFIDAYSGRGPENPVR